MTSRPPDDGSASIVAASMMAVLLAITVGAVHVSSAVIARHRAQAAADMAALAAATEMPAGPGVACERAFTVAHAMATAVADCDVDGLDVVVTVDAQVALALMDLGSARAVARAGPVS